MPTEKKTMRGRIIDPADTPFARWLTESVTERGLSLRALGERSDMTHARLSQYIGGDDPPRGAVERIARALVPDGLGADESEQAYRRILTRGLRAAGFETPMDPDLRVFVEFYEGVPPENREPLKDTMRLFTGLHRSGLIGRKAADPEPENAPESKE
jgi:transcriptional regulator with XRE-family HTH domain